MVKVSNYGFGGCRKCSESDGFCGCGQKNERKGKKGKKKNRNGSLDVESSFFAHRTLFVYGRYHTEGSLLSLTQAILIRISHSLYIIRNIVNTKMFTDFEGTDTQTDRRTTVRQT